MHIGTGNIEFQ